MLPDIGALPLPGDDDPRTYAFSRLHSFVQSTIGTTLTRSRDDSSKDLCEDPTSHLVINRDVDSGPSHFDDRIRGEEEPASRSLNTGSSDYHSSQNLVLVSHSRDILPLPFLWPSSPFLCLPTCVKCTRARTTSRTEEEGDEGDGRSERVHRPNRNLSP